MKSKILVFLVITTTILKGQSVDPETFPILNTGGGELNIKLDPIEGMTVSPFASGGSNPFTGTNIFVVKNTGGGEIFKITNTNRINQSLPAYNDDADAGTNGLLSGDTYQTSPTNTLGLPVGVIMIKQ